MLSLALGAADTRAAEKGYIGPLRLDTQGADFKPWINHFKAELYKHWPPSETINSRGQVLIEFTVGRDGAVQRLRVRKSTGGKALREAAEAALHSSKFLPLPSAYKPERVTMQLEFHLGTDEPVTPSKPER